MARLSAVLAFVTLGAAACARTHKEGPPPAESLEVPSAAPGALGALAAGTEAAPLGFRSPGATPDPEGMPEAPDDEDAEDAGASPPRDAAIESPEDVPL